MKRIVCIIVLLFVPFFFISCAGNYDELLSKDYTKMSNDDLLRYYYELEDAIAKCENNRNGTTIGVGGGSGWGSHHHYGGGGVGVSKGVGGCDSEDLRARRIDVRLAMKKRNLNP